MGGFSDHERVFRDFQERRLAAETHTTSTTSATLTGLLGIFIVIKLLEYAGYPLSFLLYMASQQGRRLLMLGGSAWGDDFQDSDMQGRTGAFSSVFRGVTGVLSRASNGVPPGLGNSDNSCYQNSIIQGLASLPSFRDYLSETTTEHPGLGPDTTNGALFELIKKLNDPGNHDQHFWIRGKLKSMSTFQQQDAQEYYSKIMDMLDKEVQNVSTRRRKSSASLAEAAKGLEDSAAIATNTDGSTTNGEDTVEEQNAKDRPKVKPNPLDGLLAQRVGCMKCGYSEGLQLIPFNCLTVSLGKDYAYDIRDCLNEYTNLEMIDGVECAKCTLLHNRDALAPLAARAPQYAERLEAVQEALEGDEFDDKTLIKKFKILKKNWRKSTKSRQAVIGRAPKALILHLNRSIFDERTGDMHKNSAAVLYPDTLDLGNWCLGSNETGEEWPRDPTRSMLRADSPITEDPSPLQYRLRAVVTHAGTHGNGHYVCYRTHPRASKPSADATADTDAEDTPKEATGEQWWRFSDESVYPVPVEQAHQRDVFMLFYERIDETSATLPEPTNVAAKEDSPLPPEQFVAVPADMLDGTAERVALPDEEDADSLYGLPTPPASSEPDMITRPSTPTDHPITPISEKEPVFDPKTYPTPPPEYPRESADGGAESASEDAEMTEAESEDTATTHVASEDEADAVPSPTTPRVKVAQSPHLMRTAGQASGKEGGDNRRSLPMVTAT